MAKKKLTKAISKKSKSKTGVRLLDLVNKPKQSEEKSTFPDRSKAVPGNYAKDHYLKVQPHIQRAIDAVKKIEMKPSLKAITPVLTLHRTDSSHILRIYDTSDMDIALNVAKNVESGTLIIVTPTDTRIFELEASSDQLESVTQPRSRKTPAPSKPIEDTDDGAEDAENIENVDADADADIDVNFSDDPMTKAMDMATEDEPTVMKTRKRETRASNQNQPNSPCGRCDGRGTTVAGGNCPVCQGRGEIRRYGAVPTRRN
jgi:hypothetical protein